jgi:hypothetical protein
MAVVIFVGSSSSVGSVGAAAAVEREWVKALCQEDTLLLSRVNSGARVGECAGCGLVRACAKLGVKRERENANS